MAAATRRASSLINLTMGTLAGSCARVARMLDEAAVMPGVKGITITFDGFGLGMDAFGQRIQPLMGCRGRVKLAA